MVTCYFIFVKLAYFLSKKMIAREILLNYQAFCKKKAPYFPVDFPKERSTPTDRCMWTFSYVHQLQINDCFV